MKAIWDVIKPWSLWQTLIFGQPYERRLPSLLRAVVFVKFPRAPQPMLVYICLFLYQTSHGFMSVWILSWDYRVHDEITIQFLLLWIGTNPLPKSPNLGSPLLLILFSLCFHSIQCLQQEYKVLKKENKEFTMTCLH